MNTDKQVTHRTTYSLPDYFGDIGGLIALLFFAMRALLLPLGRSRVAAVLASRLFHFSDDKWSQSKLATLSSKNMVFQDQKDKVHLRVPLFLDCLTLYCCRKWTTEYSRLTQACYDSVERDLDLVRWVRAKRLHGYGLSLLMT